MVVDTLRNAYHGAYNARFVTPSKKDMVHTVKVLMTGQKTNDEHAAEERDLALIYVTDGAID